MVPPTAFPQVEQLMKIAGQFSSTAEVKSVSPLGNGNINSTFLVTVSPVEKSAAARFVLQRINQQVFHQPEQVIQNMVLLSEHLSTQAAELGCRWDTPQVLPTQQGKHFWLDENGEYWRAISFIEDAHVCETVENVAQAEAVGAGLAMFHRLISQMPVHKLADTLPGFHITPTYLAQYEQVLSQLTQLNQDSPPQADQTHYCLEFIKARKSWAHVLEKAKAAEHLQLRPIHGDPKVNNMMMGDNGAAVSLIDLDTLKPGLIHYDIGDCLRSSCNALGEETEDWQHVVFDAELAQAMLRGYLPIAKAFLTDADYEYLYDGIRLIAFELGLRFFTDYLAGNLYFKVRHPTHNLMRALVQFKLTESIEAQEGKLRHIIQALR